MAFSCSKKENTSRFLASADNSDLGIGNSRYQPCPMITAVSIKHRLQTRGKMVIPKKTCFLEETSRVSWDGGHVSHERLVIIVVATDVSNFTSPDSFGVYILF